ncbi:MAG: peroxiredoxin [Legionellales bacterium]|jgi:peroxiredoxin (alkyl hydroperoxide reductase subunit C)
MSDAILVGRKAPDFTAPAVNKAGEIIGQYNLAENIKGKYALLFFYPLDFTFVCPSELIALDKRMDQFNERNVEVIGISIDSHFTHKAWRDTPVNDGGIGPVNYPLIADINHKIAKDYGVQHQEIGVAYRAAILIDKNGVVRVQIINDLPIGRNIDELVRLVDALQFHEEHGEVCPAGWKKGDKGMNATPAGVAKYLAENSGKL